MVQFMKSYFNSMDREFQEKAVAPMESITAPVDDNQPIIPISQIGTTSIDSGGGNILQNLEKNINMGASKIQIVFGQGGQGSMSSGPTAYGKQVRESIREKAKATGVQLVGVELSPAHISGLAGFDGRQGTLNEQKRQTDMNKVKDAIRFAADIGGGGVDLWSQEFNRSIIDQDWNKDKKGNKMFFGSTQEEFEDESITNEVRYLIDKRTGEPIRESIIHTSDKLFLPKYQTAKDYWAKKGKSANVDSKGHALKDDDYVDADGNYVDKAKSRDYVRLVPLMDGNGELVVKELTWKQIKEETERYNKENNTSLSAEKWFYDQKQISEVAQALGQAGYYGHNLVELEASLDYLRSKRDFAKSIEKSMDAEQKKEWIKNNIDRINSMPPSIRDQVLNKSPSEAIEYTLKQEEMHVRGFRESVIAAQLKLKEVQNRIDSVDTPQNFALNKSVNSYSDLGIDAMRVTKERKLAKPVYIGPEIGWAGDAFGGHPQEFKKLIIDSRKEMITKLKKSGMTQDAAEEKAKTHIKGMLDTSHLAMWYKHFAKKPGETDEDHLKRFKGWMKEEVTDLVKSGVVGGVQVVDSITGEHAHLPAGQGQFDVADLVKEMVKAGFKGDIISEGHEEDTSGFGQGRILTETWRAFGAPISAVQRGQPMGLRSWGGLQNSYVGHTNPTTYIVGAYVPSNEWQPWSEIGFD